MAPSVFRALSAEDRALMGGLVVAESMMQTWDQQESEKKAAQGHKHGK